MKKSIDFKLLPVFIAWGIFVGILFTLAITALYMRVGEWVISGSAFSDHLSPQQSLSENFTAGLMMTLQFGLPFGFFMFLIMSILNFGRTMGLQHKRDIVITIPYDQSFALCRSSLRLISKHKIKRENTKRGEITVKIRATRNTPFSTIFFSLSKINKDKTRVQIINRGRPIGAIIGDENIEKIAHFLASSRQPLY